MQVKKHSAGIFTDFPVPPPGGAGSECVPDEFDTSPPVAGLCADRLTSRRAVAATWLDCWVDCVTMNETGDLVWEQVRNGTNANTVLVALVTPLPKLAINRDARRL